MFIGLGEMLASCVIATTPGLLAGHHGGRLDALLTRVADVQLSFPSMLIAPFLMSAFRTGIDKVPIALTAVGWVVQARTVRGSMLSEVSKEYVQAARRGPARCASPHGRPDRALAGWGSFFGWLTNCHKNVIYSPQGAGMIVHRGRDVRCSADS